VDLALTNTWVAPPPTSRGSVTASSLTVSKMCKLPAATRRCSPLGVSFASETPFGRVILFVTARVPASATMMASLAMRLAM
jgi:hypothetical protein